MSKKKMVRLLSGMNVFVSCFAVSFSPRHSGMLSCWKERECDTVEPPLDSTYATSFVLPPPLGRAEVEVRILTPRLAEVRVRATGMRRKEGKVSNVTIQCTELGCAPILPSWMRTIGVQVDTLLYDPEEDVATTTVRVGPLSSFQIPVVFRRSDST